MRQLLLFFIFIAHITPNREYIRNSMKITATKIEHKGEKRIMLAFPYDKNVIENIRKIDGAAWSQTRKAWHIPYTGAAFS
jgi:hypothetical protein